ncbi:DUF2782 domain-containing protein [Methylophaga sulfidovorans]|uniref:DUF2782 domain-containing protein n=1 Tax=Methylophaga sulfidovorans TaxID=45496 RepID=A0A1I3X0R3_9GAMM|nr:DUF2782 domain-containing protein [Methylophaga sulfidovorans]SFK12797.1 Protein of unknown function [Methylophaga sulfidovorans]
MFNKFAIVCAVTLVMTTQVWADDEKSVMEKPPVIPEPLHSGESMEPDINIIQEDDRMVEEYRMNGQLYMIKVTPSVGKPYYLMDSDGDGSLETKSFDLQSEVVPNWILLEW